LVLLLVGLDPAVSSALGAGRLWPLAISFLLFGVFVLQQIRSEDPILPLHLFQDRIFSAASVNGLFSGMALFGTISFIPLFVQGVQGTGATEAGWSLTPLLLGWVTCSILGSRLVLVVGYRIPVISGMVVLVLGSFLLWRVTAEASGLQMTGGLVLMGMGMGVSVISMLLAVQSRFSREYLGVATSTTQFFRTIGAAIGIAVMGAVLSSGMLASLSALGTESQNEQLEYIAHHPDAIINPVTRAELAPSVLNQLQGMLGEVLQDVFLVAFIASVLALGAAFLVPAGSARHHARRE